MTIRSIFCYTAIFLLVACHLPVSSEGPAILTHFRSLRPVDTLHVEIAVDTDSLVGGDTIPNALFFTTIPPNLLQEIDYLADSSQALVLGRQYFSLDDSLVAYWVEIRQFWFQHHSLFLYNKRKKTFTNRITLAEWYGGDGGQVLIGSWLFDFDGDGKIDVIRREIQHSMVPGGEEPQEYIDESAAVLLWKNGKFIDAPMQDTAAMIRRFPIRSFW